MVHSGNARIRTKADESAVGTINRPLRFSLELANALVSTSNQEGKAVILLVSAYEQYVTNANHTIHATTLPI